MGGTQSLEGLWIVQYVGLTGKDSGSVVLVRGRVLGGDNGWVYDGTYVVTSDGMNARIQVRNFDPIVSSVLNMKGDFELEAILRLENPDLLQGNASLVHPPGVGVILKLTRFCNID